MVPSVPRSGVGSSVPPCRLRASPIDDAVTSRRLPRRENAGSSAVTSTAATFSILMSSPGTSDAEALQHVGQRLRREHRLAAVAGLVEADDEAVADERHRRGALQRRDVAQAHRGVGAAGTAIATPSAATATVTRRKQVVRTRIIRTPC